MASSEGTPPGDSGKPEMTNTAAAALPTYLFLLTVEISGGNTSQVVFSDKEVAELKYAEFLDMGCEVVLRAVVLDPHLRKK